MSNLNEDIKEVEAELSQQKLDLVGFEFRVSNLEQQLSSTLGMLEKLDSKMDSILEKLSNQSESMALTAQKLDVVSRDYENLSKRIDACEKSLVTVQVSVAKKIAYGAGGGALVAGLTELMKILGS